MNAGRPSRWCVFGWCAALVVTGLVYRGGYVAALSSHVRVGDFFQEWASARNYWERLPIYTPQQITALRYLGYRPDYAQGVFVGINGHPPACVLAALPFGLLEYRYAFALWNGLSIVAALAAVGGALRLETGTWRTWLWLPALTLLLSNSFKEQLMMGQLSIFLSLLILGTAWADRRNRPIAAGVLLGTATALKLFPGLLFVYFAVERKWRTVLAGAATVIAMNFACLALFGGDTYHDFVRYAMPEVLRYRDWWLNFSLTGWWFKLFDSASGQTLPLWSSPTTARIGSLACSGLVVAAAVHTAWQARTPAAKQAALALFVFAALLTTPICWDHYYLLLIWPLTCLFVQGRPSRARRRAAAWALSVLWLNPLVIYSLLAPPGQAASGRGVLLLLSWPTYALLTLAALQWRQAFEPEPAVETQSVPATALP